MKRCLLFLNAGNSFKAAVLALLLLALRPEGGLAQQPWVDTLYAIQTELDLVYGVAVDFAGAADTLALDISWPADDNPPPCGRPLLIMVHGGAWIAGDKAEGYAPRICADFASRGYVAASINYRKGQFHTDQFVNCNVPEWNCFNMTDTAEWYRANYRAAQDVHGAIRYLISRADDYGINPDNIFLAGESAGGFVVMAVGFVDDPAEVLSDLSGPQPDAPAPNLLYQDYCIRRYQLAESIGAMQTARPELGSYHGWLNLPLQSPYTIRAVGNLYGGAFNDIFRTYGAQTPALYLYHQPCDLIVPYNRSRLLAGYSNCFMGFPANCAAIVNRPWVYGSRGIKDMIDDLAGQGLPAPAYVFDSPALNYNCLQQALDPNLGCHALDDYSLRTRNMAVFFAAQLAACPVTAAIDVGAEEEMLPMVAPNPVAGHLQLRWRRPPAYRCDLQLSSSMGVVVLRAGLLAHETALDLGDLPAGLYFLSGTTDGMPWPKPIAVFVARP